MSSLYQLSLQIFFHSDQLEEKLLKGLISRFYALFINIFFVYRDSHAGDHFEERTDCVSDKSSEVRLCSTAASFRDIQRKERAARFIWSSRIYFSCFGNFSVRRSTMSIPT